MENHLITDNMLSTKKKGKVIFSVDRYAKLELLPPSPNSISSSNGRGINSANLTRSKNKQYF